MGLQAIKYHSQSVKKNNSAPLYRPKSNTKIAVRVITKIIRAHIIQAIDSGGSRGGGGLPFQNKIV